MVMDMQSQLRPTFNEDAVKLIERDDDGTEIVDADRTLLIIKNW